MSESSKDNSLILLPATLDGKLVINAQWIIKDFKKTKRSEFYGIYYYSPKVQLYDPRCDRAVIIQLRTFKQLRRSLSEMEKYEMELFQNDRWTALPSAFHSVKADDFEYTFCLRKNIYYDPKSLVDDLRQHLMLSHAGIFVFNGESHKLATCAKEVLLAYVDKEYKEDVIIECQGQEFKVKKLILQARSSVFNNMLTSKISRRSKKNQVVIASYDPEIVEKMVEFLTTDRIKNSRKAAVDLYKIAREYKSKSFIDYTRQLLAQTLTNENAPIRLELSKFHNDRETRKMVAAWIACKTDPMQVKRIDSVPFNRWRTERLNK